jgi:DNA (cytosine-5)-methyltransferase 1
MNSEENTEPGWQLIHYRSGLTSEKRFRVMSTFSGIGAASISWNDGEYEFVAYAEIEPFPCHVLHYRCGASRPKYLPDPQEEGIAKKEMKKRAARIKSVATLPEGRRPNFGDITQITDEDLRSLGSVDILEGGSPCQAFSVAGKRRGLNDARGNLMLAFCNLAERMRKINGLQFVVWENVHGVLSDKTNGFGWLLRSLAGERGEWEEPLQGRVTKTGRKWTNAGRVYGPDGRQVAWRTIEASLWGIPQRRKRVFVVANLGTPSHGFGKADAVLFESEGSGWNLEKGLATRQVVCATYRGPEGYQYRSAYERFRDPEVRARLDAEASDAWIGIGPDEDESPYALDMKSQPVGTRNSPALTARNESNPPAVAYALADDYVPKAARDTAFALLAGSPSGGGHKQMVVHPRKAGTLCASGAGLTRPAGMASETDFVVVTKPHESRQVILSPKVSGTLYAREAQPAGVSSEHNFLVITKEEQEDDPRNWIVRRFTPLECERLQGFPDYWTDVPYKGKLVTDGPRYKAVGNSMPCPVMAFIGHFLEAEMWFAWNISRKRARRERRPRGRPPVNGVSAMSAAERQRRRRERLRQEALSEESV